MPTTSSEWDKVRRHGHKQQQNTMFAFLILISVMPTVQSFMMTTKLKSSIRTHQLFNQRERKTSRAFSGVAWKQTFPLSQSSCPTMIPAWDVKNVFAKNRLLHVPSNLELSSRSDGDGEGKDPTQPQNEDDLSIRLRYFFQTSGFENDGDVESSNEDMRRIEASRRQQFKHRELFKAKATKNSEIATEQVQKELEREWKQREKALQSARSKQTSQRAQQYREQWLKNISTSQELRRRKMPQWERQWRESQNSENEGDDERKETMDKAEESTENNRLDTSASEEIPLKDGEVPSPMVEGTTLGTSSTMPSDESKVANDFSSSPAAGDSQVEPSSMDEDTTLTASPTFPTSESGTTNDVSSTSIASDSPLPPSSIEPAQPTEISAKQGEEVEKEEKEETEPQDTPLESSFMGENLDPSSMVEESKVANDFSSSPATGDSQVEPSSMDEETTLTASPTIPTSESGTSNDVSSTSTAPDSPLPPSSIEPAQQRTEISASQDEEVEKEEKEDIEPQDTPLESNFTGGNVEQEGSTLPSTGTADASEPTTVVSQDLPNIETPRFFPSPKPLMIEDEDIVDEKIAAAQKVETEETRLRKTFLRVARKTKEQMGMMAPSLAPSVSTEITEENDGDDLIGATTAMMESFINDQNKEVAITTKEEEEEARRIEQIEHEARVAEKKAAKEREQMEFESALLPLTERSTEQEFPAQLMPFSEDEGVETPLYIAGVGVQKKAILNMYAVAAYAPRELHDSLEVFSYSRERKAALSTLEEVGPTLPTSFVLHMVFRTNAETVASALADAISSRFTDEDNGKMQEDIRTLQHLVVDGIISGNEDGNHVVTKGTTIQFDCTTHGVIVSVNDIYQGSINDNPSLSAALCKVYLDDKTVSPSLRNSCLENCCTH